MERERVRSPYNKITQKLEESIRWRSTVQEVCCFPIKSSINAASITLPLIFEPPLHRLQYPHNTSLEMDHQAQEIPPQNLRQ
jgi:hypothetical protein